MICFLLEGHPCHRHPVIFVFAGGFLYLLIWSVKEQFLQSNPAHVNKCKPVKKYIFFRQLVTVPYRKHPPSNAWDSGIKNFISKNLQSAGCPDFLNTCYRQGGCGGIVSLLIEETGIRGVVIRNR